MNKDIPKWLQKCLTCKHCYKVKSDADEIRCRLKECRYEPYQKGGTNRKNCEYRHENGNCLKVGGFCTSVDDEYCVKGGK